MNLQSINVLMAKQAKKRIKKLYKPDTDSKIPVRIDSHKTTIFVDPGTDIELAKKVWIEKQKNKIL